MGGKSRKTGTVSKQLIDRIKGKSCGKGVSKSGLLEKGRHWWEDFPGDEVRKKREQEEKERVGNE